MFFLHTSRYQAQLVKTAMLGQMERPTGAWGGPPACLAANLEVDRKYFAGRSSCISQPAISYRGTPGASPPDQGNISPCAGGYGGGWGGEPPACSLMDPKVNQKCFWSTSGSAAERAGDPPCFCGTLSLLGTETSSKYEIKNHLGERLYYAVEENGCFDRNFCSPLRSFTIRIADNAGREVITVNRPLRCNSCLFPCFLQELEVQSPPGTIAGYVVQNWDPLLPKFTIKNESKEDVLKIIGPYATCGCLGDVDFEVKALNEISPIGKISKYWSGFVNDVFTNTANFGIQMPVDLDVKIKAVMIGACFLIVSTEHQRVKPQQAE
uniref:Phospholipid scramblase n=1 Tax=Crocodylus porosus TaxID=8502 RepID=A0A7M4F6B6_CROPO